MVGVKKTNKHAECKVSNTVASKKRVKVTLNKRQRGFIATRWALPLQVRRASNFLYLLQIGNYTRLNRLLATRMLEVASKCLYCSCPTNKWTGKQSRYKHVLCIKHARCCRACDNSDYLGTEFDELKRCPKCADEGLMPDESDSDTSDGSGSDSGSGSYSESES